MKDNTNVLIVDDEEEICILLAAIIKRSNLTPVFVHNISDAIQMAAKIKPYLTFLDITLPDGNGLDLLSKFSFQYPAMKVVIISAFDEYKSTALNIGAHSFLSKPFTKNS
ncbi:MAG: response regulator, partial [Chitinophagales bacterium]